MYVEYAYADTSYYCGKTCQAKQAAEKAKKEVTVKKAEPCYGRFCPEVKKEDTTSNSTTTKSNQISKEDIIRSISTKNFISLRVSNACKHIDSCPNVKDLADKFDNSNRYLSGDFYFDNKTDAWKRTSPKIPNVFELYKFMDQTPWVLWVDPDDYTWDRSKQIIIEPSLHYIDRSEKTIDESRMRYEYQGLSLKPCASAIIGWENNGSAILLDVLKHFYSNCKEQVKYDPTIPIFMGTKIFEDCGKQCLYMKQRLKNELKADAFAYGGGSGSTSTKPPKSTDKPCYGIYCKEDQPTKEETVKEIKDKEKVRKERLEELENIQVCEKFKARDLKDNKMNKRDAVDCTDKKERDLYLADYLVEKEHLKEIEDIKTCESKKKIDILDKKMNNNNMVDCNNKDQRDKYLATK